MVKSEGQGLDLSQVGNVSKDYQHESRTVRFHGLITNPSLVLKMYSMVKDKPFHDLAIGSADAILEYAVHDGKLEPLLGLGFAILSEDMLNVSRWGIEYPFVLKNKIFSIESNAIDVITPKFLDTNEVGAYCAWELGIVNHEKNAWLRYLTSGRTEEDKQKYLDDVLEGVLPAQGDVDYAGRLREVDEEIKHLIKINKRCIEFYPSGSDYGLKAEARKGVREGIRRCLRSKFQEVDFKGE